MQGLWLVFLLADTIAALLLAVLLQGLAVDALMATLLPRALAMIVLVPPLFFAANRLTAARPENAWLWYLAVVAAGYLLLPVAITLIKFGDWRSLWLFRRAHTDPFVFLPTYLPYLLAAGAGLFFLWRQPKER